MGVHAAAEAAVAPLLANQIIEGPLHVLGILAILFLVRLAGAQEGQQAEGGRGDVVILAEAVAIAVAVLVEAVQRPVAVGGLVGDQPFEATGHGCLGVRVAAPFAQKLFAGRAATSAAAAGCV